MEPEAVRPGCYTYPFSVESAALVEFNWVHSVQPKAVKNDSVGTAEG